MEEYVCVYLEEYPEGDKVSAKCNDRHVEIEIVVAANSYPMEGVLLGRDEAIQIARAILRHFNEQ